MKRLLVTSVIAGIIAGILAGGFYNFFQVPVIERAIALEEERAASVSPPGSADDSGAEVSLGVQRMGMVIGTTIYGAITGIFFAAGFVLLHRAAPSWPVVWVALSVGALGFLEPLPVPVYQVPGQSSSRRWRRGHPCGAAVGASPAHAHFGGGHRSSARCHSPHSPELR